MSGHSDHLLLEDFDGAPYPDEVQQAHRFAMGDLLAEIERLRAALEAIANYEVEQDWAPVSNDDCAACARCRDRRWPPSMLCDAHFRLLARRDDANAAKRAGQHYALRRIAQAALAASPEGSTEP